MALRQLAGPFDIELGASPPEIPDLIAGWIWYPHVGLISKFALYGELIARRDVVTAIDGIFQQIAYNGAEIKGWWPSASRALGMQGDLQEYTVEPKVLTPVLATNRAGDDPIQRLFQLYYFVPRYVRLADRRVYKHPTVAQMWNIVDGVATVEKTGLPFTTGGVWAGRVETEVFVDEGVFSNGTNWATKCFFYDTIMREISSPLMHLGVPCAWMTFAPDLGVIISLHTNPYQMRIWSLEVAPVTVTNPVRIVGQQQGGHLVTYQVTVLGDANDPCAGELVDWTLSGVGTLLDTQSRTDVNGQATVQVLYGLQDAGDSVVGATVTC